MAVSLYDQCTTTDWDNIALRVSQLAALLSLLLSIIALGLGRETHDYFAPSPDIVC